MNYFQQICRDSRAPAWASNGGFAERPATSPVTAAPELISLPPADTPLARRQDNIEPSQNRPAAVPVREDKAVPELSSIFGAKVQPVSAKTQEIGLPTGAVPVSATLSMPTVPENDSEPVLMSKSSPASDVPPDLIDGPNRTKDPTSPIGQSSKALPRKGGIPTSAERGLERRSGPRRKESNAAVGTSQGAVVNALEEIASAAPRKALNVRDQPPASARASVAKECRGRAVRTPADDPGFIEYPSQRANRATQAAAPAAPPAPQVRIGQVDVIIQSPTTPRPATTEAAGAEGRTPWYLRTL